MVDTDVRPLVLLLGDSAVANVLHLLFNAYPSPVMMARFYEEIDHSPQEIQEAFDRLELIDVLREPKPGCYAIYMNNAAGPLRELHELLYASQHPNSYFADHMADDGHEIPGRTG